MLHDNLICLRNFNNYSQEYVAEQVGVTRQAYAKWEKGESLPDIGKCAILAKLYGTTLDNLYNSEPATEEFSFILPPPPTGKHIFGTVIMNDKGQIVIPKKARDLLSYKAGDTLLVLGDEEAGGLAITRPEDFEQQLLSALNRIRNENNQ